MQYSHTIKRNCSLTAVLLVIRAMRVHPGPEHLSALSGITMNLLLIVLQMVGHLCGVLTRRHWPRSLRVRIIIWKRFQPLTMLYKLVVLPLLLMLQVMG
eukprot:SAG31_NODE_453_length_15464_cov_37.074064_18_plen_99_part_00